MHTIVNDATNTYCYGIALNGNYVYKFDVSAGKLIKRSDYYFTKTRAMCLASDGHLWVLDEVSTNIKIIKIDPVDMDPMIVASVNHFPNDTDATDLATFGQGIETEEIINHNQTGSYNGFSLEKLTAGIIVPPLNTTH